MYLYIDEYTPNDDRTHLSSSWCVYGTDDVSGVTPPLYEIIESIDNIVGFKLPITLTANQLWIKVKRHMSDGSEIEAPAFIVNGRPAEITPTMEAPVEIPLITILSNTISTGGSLTLVGSSIEPRMNVLEEAFWNINIDGKTVATKKSSSSTTTFTSDEVGGVELDAVITVVLTYRSLEGVSSHAAILEIDPSNDTTTKIYGVNSIDPTDTFVIRLSNSAEVLSYAVSDNQGKIIIHSTGDAIPSATMSLSAYYRLVVNYIINGEYKHIEVTAKTISAENPYEIDLTYEYTITEPWHIVNLPGTFIVDEAINGFLIKPTDKACMIIDTNKGMEEVFSLPHYRYTLFDFNTDYYIRNINNHTFSMENNNSVSVYDTVQDIRSFFKKNEVAVEAISNTTYYQGIFYYISNDLKIRSVKYDGDEYSNIVDLPDFLHPSDGRYAIEAVQGYLYISGPLDALLRVKIDTLDFDYLQNLPSQSLGRMVLMKNHNFFMLSNDSLNAFIYNYKEDTITIYNLEKPVKGLIRNQDGGVVIVYNDNTSVIYY